MRRQGRIIVQARRGEPDGIYEQDLGHRALRIRAQLLPPSQKHCKGHDPFESPGVALNGHWDAGVLGNYACCAGGQACLDGIYDHHRFDGARGPQVWPIKPFSEAAGVSLAERWPAPRFLPDR